MEAANEEMEDKTMEEQTTDSFSTASMRTSARLVAKLKKLMEMEMISDTTAKDTIEIETEEQKKQANTMTPHAGTATIQDQQETHNTTPYIKKLCNDETLPRQLKQAPETNPMETTAMETGYNETGRMGEKCKGSLKEREKPPEDVASTSV